MLRKYKNRQGGMFCIKKIIQMSSIFWVRCKIRNYILGPREEQDGDPRHGIPHPSGRVPRPSRGITKISGGMMSFSSCGIAFHGRGITFCRLGIEHQIGVMNCSQSNGPYIENL
jgi:hypothetical protein